MGRTMKGVRHLDHCLPVHINSQHSSNCGNLNPYIGAMNRQDRLFYQSEKMPQFGRKILTLKTLGVHSPLINTAPLRNKCPQSLLLGNQTLLPWLLSVKGRGSFLLLQF